MKVTPFGVDITLGYSVTPVAAISHPPECDCHTSEFTVYNIYIKRTVADQSFGNSHRSAERAQGVPFSQQLMLSNQQNGPLISIHQV